MSRVRPATRAVFATVSALALLLAGCGSTSLLTVQATSSTSPSPGVPGDAVRVIEGWSTALRTGHVAAAARYFRVPSVFFDGSDPPVELRSVGQIVAANAALPCGAKFLSATRQGRYINALFQLTNRAGPGGQAGCGSGTGLTARTNFLIRDGRIAAWLRAPDEPGDNGTPTTPTAPTVPTVPQQPTTPPAPASPQGNGDPVV